MYHESIRWSDAQARFARKAVKVVETVRDFYPAGDTSRITQRISLIYREMGHDQHRVYMNNAGGMFKSRVFLTKDEARARWSELQTDIVAQGYVAAKTV